MATPAEPTTHDPTDPTDQPLSLSTAAAPNLATTTKTPPQMREISSRWLSKVLPWVQVTGGTFRVNRRLTYTLGNQRVAFVATGSQVQPRLRPAAQRRPRQRLHTRHGPPTPADLDALVARRRKTRVLLPTRARSPPSAGSAAGAARTRPRANWRAVGCGPGVASPCCRATGSRCGTTPPPSSPCTGPADEGVAGLHQPGTPEEHEPSLNVRFMGINEQAVASYLVSPYFSAAVLVPDALGVLEDVEADRASRTPRDRPAARDPSSTGPRARRAVRPGRPPETREP